MEWNLLRYSDYYHFELQNILIDITIGSSVIQVVPKHAYCRVSVVFLLIYFFQSEHSQHEPHSRQTSTRTHVNALIHEHLHTHTYEHTHTLLVFFLFSTTPLLPSLGEHTF